MTPEEIHNHAVKRIHWTMDQWRKSKEMEDRLVAYISNLSPYNWWKGRKALDEYVQYLQNHHE